MVSKHYGKRCTDQRTGKVTLEGNIRFVREDSPDHATVQKKHNHRQGDRAFVPSQCTGHKHEEQKSEVKTTDTDMIRLAPKQPDGQTGTEVDCGDHDLRGFRVPVDKSRTQHEQRQRVRKQVLE